MHKEQIFAQFHRQSLLLSTPVKGDISMFPLFINYRGFSYMRLYLPKFPHVNERISYLNLKHQDNQHFICPERKQRSQFIHWNTDLALSWSQELITEGHRLLNQVLSTLFLQFFSIYFHINPEIWCLSEKSSDASALINCVNQNS